MDMILRKCKLKKFSLCSVKYTSPHFQREMFQECNLIDKRGLAEIIVPVRGYGRRLPNQVMIKRE